MVDIYSPEYRAGVERLRESYAWERLAETNPFAWMMVQQGHDRLRREFMDQTIGDLDPNFIAAYGMAKELLGSDHADRC